MTNPHQEVKGSFRHRSVESEAGMDSCLAGVIMGIKGAVLDCPGVHGDHNLLQICIDVLMGFAALGLTVGIFSEVG